MNKYTVVVCDHIHEAGLKMLEDDENINFIMAADVDKKELWVVKTLSLSLNKTNEAKSKAAVPFETTTQYLAPV